MNGVLRLGKDFSSSFLIKKKDMVFEIVKDIESNMIKIKKEKDREELRHKLLNTSSNFLKKSQNIPAIDKIIAQSWKETKLFLQNNSDIFITHADKENVTVILNRSDYNKRMLQLVNDNSTYKKTNYNPLKLLKKDSCKLLENWRVKDFLGKNITIKDISLNNTNLPRIYGLPKIHKENFPPTYNMSKTFANIFKESLTSPKSQGKNSFIFKEVISKIKIPSDHIMISLDVTSLFTNVPIDLVINSIEKRWNLINKATNLPLQEFQKGIEFLMKNTFFSYDNEYYHHIFRTPMGSPISQMLADLVLQDLEKVVLKKLSFKIHSYYRYVDDTFLIIPNNKIKDTIGNFNSYHSRLNFTFELEINNTLPFLNLLIIKNQDGTLVTNWFRKNTFSGRYLNFLSNHPFKQKIAIIKNLVDTAILLSHEKFHEENLEIIKNLLVLNNYPINLINKHINIRIFQIKNKNTTL